MVLKGWPKTPLQVSGSSSEAVQIDPESLNDLIDALNQVDKNSPGGLLHLNSAYEDAIHSNAQDKEKKSLLDKVSDEVGNTLTEMVSIETHIDLLVLSAFMSVVLYALIMAVNSVWKQISNARYGLPIIRVMVSHPYLLVIGTYIVVLIYFTKGQS